MRRRILPLFLVSAMLGLSACSTVVNQSSQPVEVVVRGSRYADCTLYTKNFRNTFRAPGKALLERSRYDLNVDCIGENFLRTKFSLSPTMTKETAYNVSNGLVPGGAYDALSGGMWAYPDPIIVDFRTTDDVPVPEPQWPPVTVQDPAPETAVIGGGTGIVSSSSTAFAGGDESWRMRPVQSPEDFYKAEKPKVVKKKRTAKKAVVEAPRQEEESPKPEVMQPETLAPAASEPAAEPNPAVEAPAVETAPSVETPAPAPVTQTAPVVEPAPEPAVPAAEPSAPVAEPAPAPAVEAPAAAPAPEAEAPAPVTDPATTSQPAIVNKPAPEPTAEVAPDVPAATLPQPSAPAEATPGTNVVPAPAPSMPPSADTSTN